MTSPSTRDVAALDLHVLAVAQQVEQRVVGHVDEVDAGLHEQHRAHVRIRPGRRRPAVEDRRPRRR